MCEESNLDISVGGDEREAGREIVQPDGSLWCDVVSSAYDRSVMFLGSDIGVAFVVSCDVASAAWVL